MDNSFENRSKPGRGADARYGAGDRPRTPFALLLISFCSPRPFGSEHVQDSVKPDYLRATMSFPQRMWISGGSSCSGNSGTS